MPTSAVVLQQHRALAAKLAINILTLLYKRYKEDDELVSDFVDILIVLAVLIGQTEHKRITPHSVSKYIGVPRSTVIRRVKAMEARGGIVEEPGTHLLSIPVKVLNAEQGILVSKQILRRIHLTCRALSKLDSTSLEV